MPTILNAPAPSQAFVADSILAADGGVNPPLLRGDYDYRVHNHLPVNDGLGVTDAPLTTGQTTFTLGPLPAFLRSLRYRWPVNMQGRDVLAVERCLHRHGWRWADPTLSYGWMARDNTKLFQKVVGLPIDGEYGPATHTKLAWRFDDYERWLYSHPHIGPQPSATPRQAMMHALWSYYAMRPWAYHEVRPFILYPKGGRVGYPFDCSWFVTQVMYVAGLADPNGYAYRGGAGNTQSLQQHGWLVDQAQPGDLAFYGEWGNPFDPEHVQMAVSDSHGIGFGGSGGPDYNSLYYREPKALRRYTP